MNNNFFNDPSNYNANGDLKNPMLQQMAQQAMQAQAQQNANAQSGMGILGQYRPQDGYLSGGQYAEQAKLNGKEAQLDNRELRNGEKLDRLNPFSESGYMNEKDYAKRYAPDGTLRSTGNRPEGVLDGAMDSVQGALDGRQMPAFMYGGSGVGGKPNVAAQSPAETPNTHTMPDGTVMEGATHEEYQKNNPVESPVVPKPVLIPENEDPMGQGSFPRDMIDDEGVTQKSGMGILQEIGKSITENDGTGSATNNSRSNTATAEEIKAKKEADARRNEMLIRVGGAIAGGARQGGLAAMSAGAQEYGNIQDYNRDQERLQYENDLARDQELRKQQAAQAKVDAERFGSPADIYAAQELTGKIDGLMADLSNSEYNAVGASKNWLTNKIGGMMGTDEASIRLRLQELVVDKTLSNTAFTKGAISDKEMALFRSDIPQFSDSEEVWLKWLNDYQAATRMLEHNLRTGYAPYKEQNAGRQYSGESGEDSDDVSDLLGKYD